MRHRFHSLIGVFVVKLLLVNNVFAEEVRGSGGSAVEPTKAPSEDDYKKYLESNYGFRQHLSKNDGEMHFDINDKNNKPRKLVISKNGFENIKEASKFCEERSPKMKLVSIDEFEFEALVTISMANEKIMNSTMVQTRQNDTDTNYKSLFYSWNPNSLENTSDEKDSKDLIVKYSEHAGSLAVSPEKRSVQASYERNFVSALQQKRLLDEDNKPLKEFKVRALCLNKE